MEEKQQGLESHTIALMIPTALFFDVLQFLLGFIYMGWVVGIFAGLTFWLWFRLKGIKIGFGEPKRMLGFAGTSLVEMIPVPLLAGLPAWTAFVTLICIKNKISGLVPGDGVVKLDIMNRK